jgi:hypothetical protein
MRRRGRRRSAKYRPVRKYTIAHLLSHQPKTVEKHRLYPLLRTYYRRSSDLRKVRFERRCYSLLQHARIKPENLHHFYRTYRLPKDPFFPLFFTIKREYLNERARIKREKEAYIARRMRLLPAEVRRTLRFLAQFEQHLNHAGRYPVWIDTVFPTTKKRVHEYERFTHLEWIRFYSNQVDLLLKRYRRLTENTATKIVACLTLGCIPENDGVEENTADGRLGRRRQDRTHSGGSSHGIPFPSPEIVKRQFRRLSMEHHPDRGGDVEYFVVLKEAHDILVGRGVTEGVKQ